MTNFKISQTYNTETYLEEIEIIVPKDEFDKYFEVALEKVRKTTTAPGFRKGTVPRNVVLANRYNQIADASVEIVVNEAIKDLDNLDPKPLEPFVVKSISSVSEDANSDLKIILTYLPMPKVELADISKIKVEKKEAKKTDAEEIAKEIQNIWFAYAQKLDPETKKEDYAKEKIDSEFLEKSGITAENPDIKSFEDLEKFIEEYINRTYEQSANIDLDNAIRDEIIKESKYTKIDALVNRELEKRVENYLSRFKEIGMDPKEYLEKNNVNLDDLKKEWKEQAEKDVKFEMILQEYGRQKEIKPSEEEIVSELSKLDPQTRKTYDNDEERLRSLISYYFVNNKAYVELFNLVRENSK